MEAFHSGSNTRLGVGVTDQVLPPFVTSPATKFKKLCPLTQAKSALFSPTESDDCGTCSVLLLPVSLRHAAGERKTRQTFTVHFKVSFARAANGCISWPRPHAMQTRRR